MRLQEIRLANFQSYREEQRVRVDSQLTLLAGRNNVGKSALLRALQVGLPTPTHQEGASEGFRLTCTWSCEADELVAGLRADDAMAIRLRRPAEQPLIASFVTTSTNGQIGRETLFCDRLGLPEAMAEASGPVGTKLGWSRGPFNGTARGIDSLTGLASQALANVTYVAPRRIEQGVRQLISAVQLEPDARNLADVLLDLQLNHSNDLFVELREFMREAFPGLDNLSVRTTSPPGSAMNGEPHIYFRGMDESIPLRLCGTGIEQMLALALAVLTTSSPRLILIDEPQAYLHPHAERSMLQLLADHDGHQYVIASHSHTLLRSQPLERARLLVLDAGATRVVEIADATTILSELGVTAADLWLADRLLWVEGPSEEEVVGVVAERMLSAPNRATLTIQRMPEAVSRFTARSRRQAESAFRFCSDVGRAITPLSLRMLFLFDLDEKTVEEQASIDQASAGRAVFLGVRELENLFLDAALLHAGLERLCSDQGIEPPEAQTVSDALAELLGRHSDSNLYPQGTPTAGDERKVVRGSRVLKALWWEFATAEYDKVGDGRALAELALETNEKLLSPLGDVLQRFVDD
ncbi:MAG TPA: AAA family ATPase [Conexibacter sp.]|nr:AAA family ATPase [Conexibacter sp.]